MNRKANAYSENDDNPILSQKERAAVDFVLSDDAAEYGEKFEQAAITCAAALQSIRHLDLVRIQDLLMRSAEHIEQRAPAGCGVCGNSNTFCNATCGEAARCSELANRLRWEASLIGAES